MGKWESGLLKKNLDMEVKDTQQCSVLSFINPTFPYSTIPWPRPDLLCLVSINSVLEKI
jgi:hypothetical protein